MIYGENVALESDEKWVVANAKRNSLKHNPIPHQTIGSLHPCQHSPPQPQILDGRGSWKAGLSYGPYERAWISIGAMLPP